MKVSPYEMYTFWCLIGSGKIPVCPWKYQIFIIIILIKTVFVAVTLHSLWDGKSIFAHFPRTVHMSITKLCTDIIQFQKLPQKCKLMTYPFKSFHWRGANAQLSISCMRIIFCSLKTHWKQGNFRGTHSNMGQHEVLRPKGISPNRDIFHRRNYTINHISLNSFKISPIWIL